MSKKSDIMSFDRMDTDGNGKISYREFAETLMNYIENYDKYDFLSYCLFFRALFFTGIMY